jgi:hypothetical protein
MSFDAIESANMIFITAQPDTIYFHWQVELYMYQFAKHGISNRCYALFGYTSDAPSEAAVKLSKRYNIICYKDTRDTTIPHYYIPSIRPHLLKQFFKEYPHLGQCVFYHDSDIFLRALPKFELLLKDDYGYLSDTSSYINYSYISSCAQRYKDKYPELPKDDIFTKMATCIGISEELIKENNQTSGGAQYILKGISSNYWEDVEDGVIRLYQLLKRYEEAHPVEHNIQSWTADMWAVLWTYWKMGKKTKIHNELDFSWATDTVDTYHKNNIFHLAGITDGTKSFAFYKGDYTYKNVFEEYVLNRSIFDHVVPHNATYEYVKVLKEYVNSDEYIYTKRFALILDEDYAGVYKEDPTTIHFTKAVWRSITGSYLIFYNSNSWILMNKMYESEISRTCGGIASNTGKFPYSMNWNIPCRILEG